MIGCNVVLIIYYFCINIRSEPVNYNKIFFADTCRTMVKPFYKSGICYFFAVFNIGSSSVIVEIIYFFSC